MGVLVVIIGVEYTKWKKTPNQTQNEPEDLFFRTDKNLLSSFVIWQAFPNFNNGAPSDRHLQKCLLDGFCIFALAVELLLAACLYLVNVHWNASKVY